MPDDELREAIERLTADERSALLNDRVAEAMDFGARRLLHIAEADRRGIAI